MADQKQRFLLPDALKGLAIICVCLYHFDGLLPKGYLGVDVFFVISGFFLLPGLLRQFQSGQFRYFSLLYGRLKRLFLPVLLASLICLLLGSVLMLPDDFENLAESVIASSLFSNNLLQCVTTGNYWDPVNLYKPLMHFWYVGVLMQAYVLLPLFYLLCHKIQPDARKAVFSGSVLLSVLSLLLYLLPSFSASWKFYLLPFRIFEITAGGLVALSPLSKRPPEKYFWLFSVPLLILLFFPTEGVLPDSCCLLLAVFLTCCLLSFFTSAAFDGLTGKLMSFFSVPGRASYSIYVWHQTVIAFLFYSVFPYRTALSFLVFLFITVILSILSFRFLERSPGTWFSLFAPAACFVLCVISMFIYLHAGVIRDVPELGIRRDEAHRGMHSEYCDRPYAWDLDFSEDGAPHFLVIGDSYARDWANILHEYNSDLEISYLYYTEDALQQNAERIFRADTIFFALSFENIRVPDQLQNLVPSDRLYVIGQKSFGTSNGIIYAHRGSADYFEQTVKVSDSLLQTNKNDRTIYGDHFIDMITPVLTGNGQVRVFTDEGRLISQDCRHLTEAGAVYYAGILPLDSVLS